MYIIVAYTESLRLLPFLTYRLSGHFFPRRDRQFNRSFRSVGRAADMRDGRYICEEGVDDATGGTRLSDRPLYTAA